MEKYTCMKSVTRAFDHAVTYSIPQLLATRLKIPRFTDALISIRQEHSGIEDALFKLRELKLVITVTNRATNQNDTIYIPIVLGSAYGPHIHEIWKNVIIEGHIISENGTLTHCRITEHKLAGVCFVINTNTSGKRLIIVKNALKARIGSERKINMSNVRTVVAAATTVVAGTRRQPKNVISNLRKSETSNGVAVTYRAVEYKLDMSKLSEQFAEVKWGQTSGSAIVANIIAVDNVHFVYVSMPRAEKNLFYNLTGTFLEIIAIIVGREEFTQDMLLQMIVEYCPHKAMYVYRALYDDIRCHDWTLTGAHYAQLVPDVNKDTIDIDVISLDVVQSSILNVRISKFMTQDKLKIARLRAMFELLEEQVRGTVNIEETSDTNAYHNKQFDTIGAFLLRAVNQALVKKASEENRKLAAHKSIFTSFSPRLHSEDQAVSARFADSVIKDFTAPLTIAASGAKYAVDDSRDVRVETQTGAICFFYTPESAKAGKTKQIATLATISTVKPIEMITDALADFKFDDSVEDIRPFYVDDVYKGSISRSSFLKLRSEFRTGRRSVHYDAVVEGSRRTIVITSHDVVFGNKNNRFYIHLSGGIIGSYLLVINNGRLLIDEVEDGWELDVDELLQREILAFVTPCEEYKVCPCPLTFRQLPMEDRVRYQYCLVDGQAIMSAASAQSPGAEGSYAVRTSYQATKFQHGLDNAFTQLVHNSGTKRLSIATRPLVSTEMYESMSSNGGCSRMSPIVAFLVDPRTNEDSSAMSLRYAEQCMRYQVFFKFVAKPRMTNNSSFFLGIMATTRNTSEYSHINPETGTPFAGSYIEPGMIVIAMYEVDEDGIEIDRSIRASDKEYGSYVSHRLREPIFVRNNSEKNTIHHKFSTKTSLTVTLVQNRSYDSGDKLTALYSQKSVLAGTYEAADMPIVCSGPNRGMRIDLILSPAMMVTRMTVNMMYEILMSKYAALNGETINFTSFRHKLDVPDSRPLSDMAMYYLEKLRELGHDEQEEIELPSGRRGMAYVGILGINALRHHAEDKRISVPWDPNNSRENTSEGIRYGQQEYAIMHGTGCVYILANCVQNGSDNTIIHSCTACHNITTIPPFDTCPFCEVPNSLVAITVAKTFRELQDCLAQIGVAFIVVFKN